LKQTKIVCTVGPASRTVETLSGLVDAGLNVMRMNFSHGNHETHADMISKMRKIAAEKGKNIAILLDTKGPEIRTIKLESGKDVELKAGQTFTLTTDATVVGNSEIAAVTYKGLADDLKEGNTVLIDDGLLELTVKEISGDKIICDVINSGMLGENKGVNLPNVSVKLPALSEKDISDLIFGCHQGVDFIAASFIRKADDVKAVRDVLDANGGEDIQIISKIENQEGLDNFDEILELSDGIMVARGDLGVEIPVEDVPFAQKEMIKKCNIQGKIVITATQMLDSMIHNPRPTRAEAGDVANAILDGTDAVMLSGETAKGAYPIEAVEVMARIADKSDSRFKHYPITIPGDIQITEAVAKGTVESAETLKAKLIIVATETGRAARAIRKYRPSTKILAITNNEQTARQLMITRGIYTSVIPNIPSIEEFHKLADKTAKDMGFVTQGDIAVVSCGQDIFKPGTTNNFKVHVID